MDQEKLLKEIKVFLDKGYDYEDTLKRMSFGQKEVMQLKERLDKLPNVPNVQEKLCLQYLNGTNGDVDEAEKRIQKYYEIKTSSPELFWNRDPDSEELQLTFKIQRIAALPITPDKSFVFIQRTVDPNTQIFNFDTVFKTFMMIAEYNMLIHGPQDGSILISDWNGTKFGHIFQPRISSIRKGLDFIQHASPLKTKAVHILNSSHLFQVLFSIIKPFMKKELADVIHIHTADMDYNEFFEKHVPRHCMPSDYGGDLPSLDELHAKNIETLRTMKEYYRLEELHFKSGIEKSSI
ncbi:alpha-tocopherol transfer protein-like [Chironomus tepperi]|uniref:alpha-tocopherol transfer protein-like n=1 Tax=Chironomus tepperi TaxID=113505 RepID=UPI00391EF5DC